MGMGQLIDGKWTDEEATARLEADGSYKRLRSKIRNWVTEDGLPGPSGEGGFKAEAGRYHLYISLSCPFAHRAAIMRRLKKLEGVVSISVAARRTSQSWEFDNDSDDYGDAILGSDYLYEVYVASHPKFTGRVTVPVLWDTALGNRGKRPGGQAAARWRMRSGRGRMCGAPGMSSRLPR